MSGSATIMRVVGDHGEEYAVVTQADDEIWIARELWELARDPMRSSRIEGDLEINQGEELLVSFGIPGKGLGRVTYRVVERQARWLLCKRVHGDPGPLRHYDEIGPDEPMPPAVRYNAV